MILSVDPGLRGCGVAVVEPGPVKAGRKYCGYVVAAAYLRSPGKDRGIPAWDRMASKVLAWWQDRLYEYPCNGWEVRVEDQQFYAGGKQGAPHATLQELHGVAVTITTRAAFRMLSARIVLVKPYAWKRQLDKDVHHKRIRGKLTPSELAVVDVACADAGKSYAHNVMDAVAFGLRVL